jgi:hypothetical protein
MVRQEITQVDMTEYGEADLSTEIVRRSVVCVGWAEERVHALYSLHCSMRFRGAAPDRDHFCHRGGTRTKQ